MLSAITFALIGLYAYLGGFRPIEATLAERDDYQLIGHYYAGEYDGDSLRTLFFEAKDLISSGELEGNLIIVHYSPVADQDSISIFVGVAVPDLPEVLPTHLEHRTLKGGKVIRAEITAHSFVRPLRNKVDESMEAFAMERNMKLRSVVLEHYLSEDELHIERLVE